MKKLIIVTLIIFHFLNLKSQNRYEVGIINGKSYSSLVTTNQKHFDYLSTYTVGGTFQYNISKNVSFVTGLSYEKKGCSGRDMKMFYDTTKIGYYSFEYGYNFITVPMLFRYSIGGNGKVFVNAGPYVGIMLRYTEKFDNGRLVSYRTDDMNRIDVGFSSGAGIIAPMDKDRMWNITTEIRSNVGFRDMIDGSGTYGNIAPAYKITSARVVSVNILIGISYKIE